MSSCIQTFTQFLSLSEYLNECAKILNESPPPRQPWTGQISKSGQEGTQNALWRLGRKSTVAGIMVLLQGVAELLQQVATAAHPKLGKWPSSMAVPSKHTIFLDTQFYNTVQFLNGGSILQLLKHGICGHKAHNSSAYSASIDSSQIMPPGLHLTQPWGSRVGGRLSYYCMSFSMSLRNVCSTENKVV